MKKFMFTGFVFLICIVVFLIFNMQSVSQYSRFQGVAYAGGQEIESDVSITFTGDVNHRIFQASKFNGTLTIASGMFSEVFDDVSFSFEDGVAECVLTDNDGTEFGILKVSDDFESFCIEITNSQYTNGNDVGYLSAPATSVEQAEEIMGDLF